MDPLGYDLVFEDRFTDPRLDRTRWLPYYLPQWSSRSQAAARYTVGDGLRLRIEADQPPWCPELDGNVRVSSLQTGIYAGPLGSRVGQHRFNPAAVVREAQDPLQLYTPRYGRVEVRAKASDDPAVMVALWMIGFEDRPDRSAEICVCEIFGREVRPDGAQVGMGVRPFGDSRITDEFEKVPITADVRDFHVYAAEWTLDHVAFFVDGERRKVVDQSPNYPMQVMLGIYDFGGPVAGRYPKEFAVDYVRGYQPAA
jgi:Glycosyl hydrolases family 16